MPEGGVVILDDYYAWDGCARATHDFLSRHDLPYRIRDIQGGGGAYFVKRAYRVAPSKADSHALLGGTSPGGKQSDP